MHTARGLATTAFLAAITSCSALGSHPDVLEVSQQEDVTVGGGPTTQQMQQGDLDTPQMGSGLKGSLGSQLDNQGVSKEDVSSVKVKRVHLEVLEPMINGRPAVDLDFLTHLAMYISAPGLPEVKVAQGGPETFAAGVTAVDVPLEDVELKAYVTADSMTVRTEVEATRPTLSCKVRFTTALEAHVSVAGVLGRLPQP